MVRTYEQYLDSKLVDTIQEEMELSFDNGDFSSDDWIDGQAMQAAGLPQLED